MEGSARSGGKKCFIFPLHAHYQICCRTAPGWIRGGPHAVSLQNWSELEGFLWKAWVSGDSDG